MAKCASCGRNLGGFSFGKRLCRWCVDYEAGKRGDAKGDDIQRVMPTPWKKSDALGGVTFNQLFVGINLLVFLAMVGSGISLMSGPNRLEMVHWGGNFGPLTLSDEPWRIVTYMFLHYGLIHIGFNLWCLWDLGALAESLYGDWTFAVVYLLCGLGGGVMSVWWHPGSVSAGASGAIFGLAGALIASLKLGDFSLPRAMISGSLRSVVAFAGYNLVFGAISGFTDNACHIGGLLTGLILGALIAVAAPNRDQIFRRLAICLAMLLLLVGAFVWTRSYYGVPSPWRFF
jgi:rhomboid protease GluP